MNLMDVGTSSVGTSLVVDVVSSDVVVNSLSIEMGLVSGPVEVLEYRMGFASDPVEVPEQGDHHVPFVAIGD